MTLISATQIGASYAGRQKASMPARHVRKASTKRLPGIFQPLVISRMNRTGLELEQLMRKKGSKA